MSTPLNCCQLAPDSIMAFRVRQLQLHYIQTLLYATERGGFSGVSLRIFVSLRAEAMKSYSFTQQHLLGQNRARSSRCLQSLMPSHPLQLCVDLFHCCYVAGIRVPDNNLCHFYLLSQSGAGLHSGCCLFGLLMCRAVEPQK